MTLRSTRRLLPIATSLAVLAAVSSALAGCATGGVAGTPGGSVIQIGSPLIGKPAPALSGTTLDGAPFDLAALRGSPVLVNFWASWCVPCRDEFPILAAAEKRHAAEGLKVVGVLFKDDAEPARSFVAAQKADWPTVADPGRTIAQPWAVLAPPQTYFIDRDGIVRDLQIGQVRDAAELDSILAAILR
jgi:cytochrome c biogenesis protein CcmG/thiol:disulfide interchange protein DsbE